MSKVYITNGNFKKIISPFNFKGIAYGRRDFFIDIQDFDITLLKRILSTPELALLDAYREILADLKEGLAMYTKVKKQDTHKYVYEGTAPAYHFSHECERLRSDFTNYEIPEIIKDDAEKILKFRVVFKECIALIKNGKIDVATNRINSAMGWPYGYPSIADIDFKNGGAIEFENANLEDVIEKINQILFDAEIFRNSEPNVKDIIDHLGYGTHKRKEIKDQNHPLYKWHNYKTELKHVIQTYFRVKLNPELKFEGEILDELGFRPCSFCSNTNFENLIKV